MATILQTTFSWKKNILILIPILINFVPNVPVDYKSLLAQYRIQAWF